MIEHTGIPLKINVNGFNIIHFSKSFKKQFSFLPRIKRNELVLFRQLRIKVIRFSHLTPKNNYSHFII
jgi:hypothetical protein